MDDTLDRWLAVHRPRAYAILCLVENAKYRHIASQDGHKVTYAITNAAGDVIAEEVHHGKSYTRERTADFIEAYPLVKVVELDVLHQQVFHGLKPN